MSGRQPNVGRRDRIVRALLTPITVGTAVWLYASVPTEPLSLAAIAVLSVLAFIFSVSALTGTCGIYAALGIDTCQCGADYGGGSMWG